jgi:NAD+ kinase
MLRQVTVSDSPACAVPGPRRVAVLTHLGREEAIDTAARLIEGLAAADIECYVPADDLDVLTSRLRARIRPMERSTLARSGDFELMIVLGGDGTILRGAEWVLASDTPLLGVNLGHVGFLAEAESSEIDNIVHHVVGCSYTVEERFTIDVSVHENGECVWSSFAINEVSIDKAARERMLEIAVEVDHRPLSRWACDGLLLSTPTGSTAYAFSAGGPVIWPEVDALLIMPLSAHALFSRPLVVGPNSAVSVNLVPGSPTYGLLWCDGHRSTEFHAGMEIEVVRGRHRLRLARLSESPFTNRLVNKFHLPVDGWRGRAERERDLRERTSDPAGIE